MTHYLSTAFHSPVVGWLTIAFFLLAAINTYFREVFGATPGGVRSGPAWLGLLLWIEILLKLTLFVINWQYGLLVYVTGVVLAFANLLGDVGSILMLPFAYAKRLPGFPDPDWRSDPFWQGIAHRRFLADMVPTIAAYVGLSLVVRAWPHDTAHEVAWAFQIVRLAVYVYIFWLAAARARDCGYRVFWEALILAIVGRINNFEMVVIPVVVLASYILSKRPRSLKPIRPD